jgi:hypothetical protein
VAILAALLTVVILPLSLIAEETKEPRAPETFTVVIGSEVDNQILSGDVEAVYTYFAKWLGKDHVILSAYFDKGERGRFYERMLKEDKRTMQASPRRLKEALSEAGRRSKPGDAILIYLDGHGDQQELARPETNTIGFSDDDMAYTQLQKVITEQLPGRRVMIFNLLCYGGGNHQVAFRLPNVSTAVGTSYRFSKSNPGKGDQFVKGFYQTLKREPAVSFAMVYWQARLNDSYNADHAAISSEAYLDAALGQGDYAPVHKTPRKAGDSLQVSIERTQSLGTVVGRIEDLHKKGDLAKPSDLLPKELIKAGDRLTIQQLQWLQNVCGTEEWSTAKANYSDAKAEYLKKTDKWAKKTDDKKAAKRLPGRLLTFEEDMRKDLCEDYYCLVLAREVFEKMERLNVLFTTPDLREQQSMYLDLVERENQPVLLQRIAN